MPLGLRPASARNAEGRPWGGIQTQDEANQEVARIHGELEKLKADALIVYAAGGPQQAEKIRWT